MHDNFWDSLDVPVRNELEPFSKRLKFRTGAVIQSAGANPARLFIVQLGVVKVIDRAGPQTVVLAIRGVGDIIGELGFVLGDSDSAAIVAVTAVTALRVSREAFAAVLERHPAAADSLHRTVAARLREADRDRIAAASMNVGQQLARLLLKIVQRNGIAPADGLEISGLSQSELAGCIGSTPRTVARVVRAWRNRGIVATNRRTMIVHRPDELQRIAGLNAPTP